MKNNRKSPSPDEYIRRCHPAAILDCLWWVAPFCISERCSLTDFSSFAIVTSSLTPPLFPLSHHPQLTTHNLFIWFLISSFFPLSHNSQPTTHNFFLCLLSFFVAIFFLFFPAVITHFHLRKSAKSADYFLLFPLFLTTHNSQLFRFILPWHQHRLSGLVMLVSLAWIGVWVQLPGVTKCSTSCRLVIKTSWVAPFCISERCSCNAGVSPAINSLVGWGLTPRVY